MSMLLKKLNFFNILLSAMALLVLLPAAAGAGIVAARGLLDVHGLDRFFQEPQGDEILGLARIDLDFSEPAVFLQDGGYFLFLLFGLR